MKQSNLFFFTGFLLTGIQGWPCSSTGKAFRRLGSNATLKFNIRDFLDMNQVWGIFTISYYTGVPKARVTYSGTTIVKQEALPGVAVTANSDGDVVVTSQSSQILMDGTYTINNFERTKCICLYTLGIPTRPAVFNNRDPSIGESVTLTCSSTSTTKPSNHSLSLLYDWKLDGLNSPVGNRYSYSASRHTLTLSNVVKEDARKEFSCAATEDVTDGYTSAESSSISISVLYGPSSAEINISSFHEATEDTVLPDILCFCDCSPACSYSWSFKAKTITNGMILSLGKAKRQHSGNYTCICSSSLLGNSKQSTFTLLVQFAPDVSVRVSPATVKQEEAMSIFCNAVGEPDNYNFTGFVQIFDGKVIDEMHKTVYGTQENSSIFIQSPQFYNSGIYTCKVNNGIRKTGVLDQSASTYIKVQGRPIFYTKDKTFYGVVDEDIVITLPFYSYPEFQNITVFRSDGFQLTPSAKYKLDTTNSSIATFFYKTNVSLNGTVLRVFFSKLSDEDFTEYTVVIDNSVSRATYTVSVNKKGPPLSPKYFKVSLLTGILKFTWESNSNGGSEQYFLIQMSSGNYRDWKNQTVVREFDDQYLVTEGHYVATVAVSIGHYRFRIIAANAFGSAEAINWSKPLEVPLVGEQTDSNQDVPSKIIGSVLNTVIAGLVITLIILAMRIRKLEKSKAEDSSKGSHSKEISQREGVSYANVTYTPESTTHEEKEQYQSLDVSQSSEMKTYDVILSDSSIQ